MRILLINLDRSPERLKRMDEVLTGSGLTFERVPAVDGKLLSDAEKKRWMPDDGKGRRMTAGEIGCFLSHRKCWEAIAAGAESHAVIFEDDIHLGRNATEILSRTDWIPADAEVIKIETFLNQAHVDKVETSIVYGRKLVRLRKNSMGAAGYILSSQAASKLISLSEVFSDPVDEFLFNPKPHGFLPLFSYQFLPALCIQDHVLNRRNTDLGTHSTIESGRNKIQKRIIFRNLLRKIDKPFEQLFKLFIFAFSSKNKITINFE